MTDRPEPLDEALADHDVTLAMTPGQVVLLAIGVVLLVRIIRSFRG
ncbi:MAG: hypothetical protein K5924_07320 [Chloroflexi bacterium]|nr:hypothetical protein [Chloroflexota bacterium]